MNPDRLLVVCSHDTCGLIDETLEKAGLTLAVHRQVMEDPVAGIDEIDGLIKDVAPLLASAERVFVNLTGGTTLMGLVVEQIACKAVRLGRPVRRLGLIDRRPREEQLAEPFVAAEPYWIDSEENDA